MAAWLGTSAIGGYVAGALGGVPIWWACWLTMGLCLVGAGGLDLVACGDGGTNQTSNNALL